MTSALLLDSGGVLVRITGDLVGGVAARHGIRLSATECVRGVHVADVLRAAEPDLADASFASRWGRAVGCDAATAEALWREITAITTDAGLWSTPNREAFEMFAQLPSQLPKIVVSNAAGGAAQELRNLGLRGHVDGVLDSGDVGVCKPGRTIFEMAALAAGVPLTACVYVSDNLDAPAGSGLRQVLYDPFGVWPARFRAGVFAVITSLAQLPGLLREGVAAA